MSDDLMQSLMRAWEADLLRGRKRDRSDSPWRPANVYASKRRRCTRAMALDLLHPEDDPLEKPIQFERLEQGIESERAILARLHKIGPFCDPPFTVAEQQHRFETRDRDGVVLITGRMDGRLRFQDGSAPPFEVKSGRTYEGCETLEDLDRNPWGWAAIDQLLAYLYADRAENYPESAPWGFIFIRRLSHLPVAIRVNLLDHLDRVEAFLLQARQAVDARQGRAELPPYIQNPAECRRCAHFGKSCAPPLDYGPGAQVIDDPSLIEALAVRERNRDARDEYEQADRMVKKELRGVEIAIAGDYRITGAWSPVTKYELPEEVKRQYARVEEKGRFSLSIERIK